jgi:1L-myo-inositol 1-phosphate cytidylyltransferase
VSNGLPKPLVPFLGKPIIEHIILSAHSCGIGEFVIVLGYGSELIRLWFQQHHFPGVSVKFVANSDYNRSNGISALKARNEIRGNFLLLMADHPFEPETASALMDQRLAPGEVILAVDSSIDTVFDLDDATKVRCEDNFIVEIGKDLASYNALDTGMCLCSPALFTKLESVSRGGDCSLSDGMRQLARERKLRAWQIGAGLWHDLDTPEALAHAQLVFAQPTSRELLAGSLSYV